MINGLARLLTTALLLAVSWPAEASVFEMFGASPRAAALGSAMAASARGGEAAFHNPALLMASPLAGAWFGVSATGHRLFVQLERPVCTGDYLACRAQHTAGFSQRAPQLPKDSQAFELGWHYPLGGVFRGRFALGAGLALPVGHIIRISGPDPQTPSFALYEGMPDRIAFLFAGAARITDWWWVGVGTQVLAVLDARIDLRLDPTNHRMDHAEVGIGLAPRARLTAGTALHPHERLWLGLSYRQQLSLFYRIPTNVRIGQPIALDIDLGHETLFTPDILHVAFDWRLPGDSTRLMGDLGLELWSQAPDPSPYVSLDVSGKAVAAFGLQDTLDVGTDTPPIQLGFANVFVPSGGIEQDLGEHWVLRAGFRYRPTPAPRATGAFNYLDNPTLALSAGVGLKFGTLSQRLRDRLDLLGTPEPERPAAFHVDLGLQGLWLARRTVYKADANDPVGNLSHGGQVWHAALAFGGSF